MSNVRTPRLTIVYNMMSPVLNMERYGIVVWDNKQADRTFQVEVKGPAAAVFLVGVHAFGSLIFSSCIFQQSGENSSIMPLQLPQINLVNVDQRRSIDAALDALAEGSTRSPRALLSPRPESMRLQSPRVGSPREDERDRKNRRASLNLQDVEVLPPLSPRAFERSSPLPERKSPVSHKDQFHTHRDTHKDTHRDTHRDSRENSPRTSRKNTSPLLKQKSDKEMSKSGSNKGLLTNLNESDLCVKNRNRTLRRSFANAGRLHRFDVNSLALNHEEIPRPIDPDTFFNIVDVDANGVICFKELVKAFNRLATKEELEMIELWAFPPPPPTPPKPSLTEAQRKELEEEWRFIDKEEVGSVNLADFVCRSTKRLDINTLRDIFESMDSDKDGVISKEDYVNGMAINYDQEFIQMRFHAMGNQPLSSRERSASRSPVRRSRTPEKRERSPSPKRNKRGVEAQGEKEVRGETGALEETGVDLPGEIEIGADLPGEIETGEIVAREEDLLTDHQEGVTSPPQTETSRNRKTCICIIPHRERRTLLSADGCVTCRCKGCHPIDAGTKDSSSSRDRVSDDRRRSASPEADRKREREVTIYTVVDRFSLNLSSAMTALAAQRGNVIEGETHAELMLHAACLIPRYRFASYPLLVCLPDFDSTATQ
ncbi:hypothetical protein PROFUN_02829 [Planoprotostelium fungivorum]|uniref:EF-hand domain-containing protein n=1 Tax=Planoprotostelium fungivorum TaxID=1890364 RepID=A0A2P6NXP4_9EUKA|nr:hypothetical protein PROFUN_02829 [Planoprotostelium fungivorum]